MGKHWKLTWPDALGILIGGITVQYAALAIVDYHIKEFPAVRDVFMEWLPNVQFGIFGEIFFFALVAAIIIPLVRKQPKELLRLAAAIGIFYLVRGVIQLLFPIGAPIDAVTLDSRITIWGYESHAYFPGGHIGVMTIMLYYSAHGYRKWLILGAVLFALGTAIARTHYTVDSIVGAVLGYAIAVWAERRWTT